MFRLRFMLCFLALVLGAAVASACDDCQKSKAASATSAARRARNRSTTTTTTTESSVDRQARLGPAARSAARRANRHHVQAARHVALSQTNAAKAEALGASSATSAGSGRSVKRSFERSVERGAARGSSSEVGGERVVAPIDAQPMKRVVPPAPSSLESAPPVAGR